jgi:hypothetical protein
LNENYFVSPGRFEQPIRNRCFARSGATANAND